MRWVTVAWLVGLAAGMLFDRALLPRNMLGLVPIAAVSGGAALEWLLPPVGGTMDVYRVGAQAVVAIWFLSGAVSVWLHGWRFSARQSLEVVAAPYAQAAVAGRACGEFLSERAQADCTVMNLTGLSSIFFYAPNSVSVGPTAWLAGESSEPDTVLREAMNQHVPDVIVTDESRCPILSFADDAPERYTFARVIEGRYAVYARDGVLQSTRVGAGDHEAELAVVVVAHNGVDATERCLRSIERTVDVPYELVLVDNGSTDSTRELFAGTENANVVRFEDNRGFAAGVNAGVAAAAGELVLMLHNDVVLTEGCVSRMVDTLRRENAAAAGPQAANARPPQRVPSSPVHHLLDLEAWAGTMAHSNPGRALVTDSLGGFCLLVRRDVFDAVGGFDGRFSRLLYGDVDFCRRLAERDVRMVVALDTVVEHRGGLGWFERFRSGVRLDELFRRSLLEFSARWQVVPELQPPDTLRAAGLRAHARGLVEENDLVDALELLTDAARTAPADPLVFNDVGAVLWAAGRHEEAFRNFRRATEIDPGLTDAAANLLDAAKALGRTDEVERLLRTAQRVSELGLGL